MLSAGEIHAVWDHSGKGLYEGNWPRTMAVLRKANVTDLFLNVGGVDFAHYASARLPKSQACRTHGDQLADCLKAAQGTGIRVHAWFICFNATRQNEALLETFRKNGWRLNDAKGALTTYLDPSNAGVRARVLSAVDELARTGADGVHLDFVRWGDAAVKPPDAAQQISSFVAEARRRVKRPKKLTAAVYGKYPACIASVGQDWDSWLNANLVDYVVPMDYTEDKARFESFLAQHAAFKAHARKTIVGIGVTANESRLSARDVIDQVNLVRRYNLAGEALFDLDTTLEKDILPYLKLGQW